MVVTERSVSYSIGMKLNIGNYQSLDFHISESERFDPSGLTDTEIDDEATKVYKELKERVDAKLIESITEAKETFNV